MKIKFFIVAGGMVLLSCLSACHHHYNDHDISVSVKESDDEYQFTASFDEDQTGKVKNFISRYTKGRAAFRHGGNVEIDGNATLDDNAQVYIRCHAGKIKIKFDRDANSQLGYEHAKEMCEGIKDILTEDNTK